MGCGFIPHHWDAILTALKSGKLVYFTQHSAIWNEKLQCGWVQVYHATIKKYCRTFHGWDSFKEALLDSIGNDEYRLSPPY